MEKCGQNFSNTLEVIVTAHRHITQNFFNSPLATLLIGPTTVKYFLFTELEYRRHDHGQLSPSSSRHSSPSPPIMRRDPSTPPYNAPPTPPEHGSDTKVVKRRRGNLPKTVTIVLRDWLVQHKKHPYPTEDEKLALAKQTKLTMNQISNWFINARRRILQPMLNSEHARNRVELEVYPYEATDNSGEFGMSYFEGFFFFYLIACKKIPCDQPKFLTPFYYY